MSLRELIRRQAETLFSGKNYMHLQAHPADPVRAPLLALLHPGSPRAQYTASGPPPQKEHSSLSLRPRASHSTVEPVLAPRHSMLADRICKPRRTAMA